MDTTREAALLRQLHHVDGRYPTQVLRDLPIPQSAVSEAMLLGRRRRAPTYPHRALPPTPPPTPTKSLPRLPEDAVPFLALAGFEQPSKTSREDWPLLSDVVRPRRPSDCTRTATAPAAPWQAARKTGRRRPSGSLATNHSFGSTSTTTTSSSSSSSSSCASNHSVPPLDRTASSPSERSSSTSSGSSSGSAGDPYDWGTPQSFFDDDDSDDDDDDHEGGWAGLKSLSRLCTSERRRRLRRKIVTAMREPWSPGKVVRQ